MKPPMVPEKRPGRGDTADTCERLGRKRLAPRLQPDAFSAVLVAANSALVIYRMDGHEAAMLRCMGQQRLGVLTRLSDTRSPCVLLAKPVFKRRDTLQHDHPIRIARLQ